MSEWLYTCGGAGWAAGGLCFLTMVIYFVVACLREKMIRLQREQIALLKQMLASRETELRELRGKPEPRALALVIPIDRDKP